MSAEGFSEKVKWKPEREKGAGLEAEVCPGAAGSVFVWRVV